MIIPACFSTPSVFGRSFTSLQLIVTFQTFSVFYILICLSVQWFYVFVNINLKMLIVLQLEFFLIVFCVMKYIAFYLTICLEMDI